MAYMIQIDTYIFKSSCCAVNSARGGGWGRGKGVVFLLFFFIKKNNKKNKKIAREFSGNFGGFLCKFPVNSRAIF